MKMMRKILLGAMLLGTAAPLFAQSAPAGVSQRVDRLEKEMRAVQRKVFPGSDGQQYFEPEIAPASNQPAGGNPSSSPVADLTARVGSLEQELARLTGQTETNNFKLRQLEDALNRYKGDTDARMKALEGGGSGSGPSGGSGGSGTSTGDTPAYRPAKPSRPADDADQGDPVSSQPRKPDVAPPATGDAGEDAYLAAYRLWDAKQYPQSITALKAVAAKYPKHKRASYTQNLLGRALLDSGQPASAAKVFYANYQNLPRGDRAPDSLYFLGQSLMTVKPPKPADACKVYAELLDVYGEKLNDLLKQRVAKGREDAKCGSER